MLHWEVCCCLETPRSATAWSAARWSSSVRAVQNTPSLWLDTVTYTATTSLLSLAAHAMTLRLCCRRAARVLECRWRKAGKAVDLSIRWSQAKQLHETER